MHQSEISKSNAVTGPQRRPRWSGLCVAALSVSVLLMGGVAAQETANPAKGAQEKAARTPEERAAGVKRRRARAAAEGKAGANRSAAVGEKRFAMAIKQISDALEAGEMELAEAFGRIELVKKGWIEATGGRGEVVGAESTAGGAVVPAAVVSGKSPVVAQAEASATKKPAAKKPAAKKPAAKKPAAKKPRARTKPTAAEKRAAVKAKAAKARAAKGEAARAKALRKVQETVAASASASSRPQVSSVQAFDSAQGELTKLVATYNTTERRLNQAVAAGEVSRAAASRQLKQLQDELAIASGAASANQKPKQTLRYKAKERELGRKVARGLMSPREAQRDLRMVLDVITADLELKRDAAASALERQRAAQAQAAKKKPAGKKKPAAKKPAAKKPRKKKPAKKQPAKGSGQPNS